MAGVGGSVLTLVDHAKRIGPDGKVAKIAEMLNQTNRILDDAAFVEGNLPVGHRINVRTSLPSPTWRQANQGVAPTKSTTAQLDEQIGMLESWSEVDKDIAELNGNTYDFRLSEAKAFIQGMGQEMAQTLIYGNAGTAPAEFSGLATRYNSLSGVNGQNIISAGTISGGDGTSIWLVGWGPETVFMVYPKGSQAGLMHEDLGLVTVETTAGIAGNRMRAYQDHWQWKLGLAVKDWRYAARIANIDISALKADTAGSTVKLIEYMAQALDLLPELESVRPAFYMARTTSSLLRIQAMNKNTAAIEIQSGLQQLGRPGQMSFLGVPIHTVDQIIGTESQVS
jgi:hypothetical protein